MITEHFYDYFFGSVNNLEDFEAGVERFRVKAMWLFGNFHFAFKKLGTSGKRDFEAEIKKTEPRSAEDFETREPFGDIEPISTEDLGLLGYVSGKQKIADLEICLETLGLLNAQPQKIGEILSSIGAEKQTKMYDITFPPTGASDLSQATLAPMLSKIKDLATSLRSRQAKAVEIGLRNTHRYLTLPFLDVYVATSMRTQQDYESQHYFIGQVFTDSQVKDLNLRYFDPTVSYCGGVAELFKPRPAGRCGR
jgi:hypothetical protein